MTKLKTLIDQMTLKEREEENYSSIRMSGGVYLGQVRCVAKEMLQNPERAKGVREEMLQYIQEAILWDAYGPLKNELHELHADVAQLIGWIRPEGYEEVEKVLKRLSVLIDGLRL